ncbi:DUF3570 domain-containing protein [Paraflavisolibacter sp. H34]|uniref:DUF3570 domain-containing protein n=1 Tax=Huijunlia imazamoxiresistens TaxID=3127457 RepID=UPI003018473D
MKKIYLSVLGMYLGMIGAFAQNSTDTAAYKPRKLKLEEVNFVSAYYHQDGSHSAVTGGEGTEKLSDVATTIELKLLKYDRHDRRHNWAFELGVDHYTSASSDNIDPYQVTSPSYSDNRIYPSLSWNVQNEKRGFAFGLNASFSNEYDYNSLGAGVNVTQTSKDRNREFTAKLQGFFDSWKVILPIELRGATGAPGTKIGSHEPRRSYSASFSLSQVVNEQLQVLVLAEPTYQEGLLATKYQRVYFAGTAVGVEELPGSRLKLPLGLRANYFWGDRFILRSFYRYYLDDWGVRAHTAELELPVKLTSFVSLSPFYRFYSQTAADYFAPKYAHRITEAFFTSDYDLSQVNSNFFGTGLRLSPPKGVFGINRWNSLELRYGHYRRSDGLQSDILSLSAKFK